MLGRRDFLALAWMALPAAAAGWALAASGAPSDPGADRDALLSQLRELEALPPGGAGRLLEVYTAALAAAESALDPLGLEGTVRPLVPQGTALERAVQATEWPGVGRLDLAVSLRRWTYPAVVALVAELVGRYPAVLLALALGQGRGELAFGIFGLV